MSKFFTKILSKNDDDNLKMREIIRVRRDFVAKDAEWENKMQLTYYYKISQLLPSLLMRYIIYVIVVSQQCIKK